MVCVAGKGIERESVALWEKSVGLNNKRDRDGLCCRKVDRQRKCCIVERSVGLNT